MDPSLITEHANHLRVVFHPLSARRWIVNWDEVSSHLLGRAERELTQFTQDDTGAALLAELRGYAGPSPQRATARIGAADVLLPIHIKKDEVELRLFTTIMTLGTPQDVTLQELRLETFFPADEESERHWMRISDPD